MTAPAPWPRDQPLRLRSVVARRGGATVLRGVDLAFEPGHRHVIVGASGSGKSTLIRLLNRLDDPDSGSVTLGDVPLARWPVLEVRRQVGLVAQSPRPLPGTLGDNLAFPHLARRSPVPSRPELAAALAEVGLDPNWLDRDAGQLSGGERQRLALATALGLDPEILVLDEPTAALDPAAARRVADLLHRRHAAAALRTIVVTHDRGLAPALGDRCIRLEAGAVADEGPTADVLRRAETTDGDE